MQFPDQFICATHDFCDLEHSVPAPYFRRTFTLEESVRSAEILICGLGFYKLYINGVNITKGELAPYISNPDDVLYYDRYDIANHLKKGKNVIGVLLGNGMLNSFGGYVWDFEKAMFRSSPKVALQANMKLASGESTIIISDESFRVSESPICFDDLRCGEKYDANREQPGWNTIDFDDCGWGFAQKAICPKGEKVLCSANPVIVAREIKPVSITRKEDHYIYDFGVNLAGFCRLQIRGRKGQKVEYIHGEYLEDGELYVRNLQFIRPEYMHLPPYLQKIEYICKGDGMETYVPSFTYHGFRYVSVSGITEEQATPDLLTYLVVHSDLREMGSFSCSDDTMNKLQQMTRNATLSNFVYFPTDCPHREKNGWTGDASLSAEHTLLNLNPEASYREWLRNIRMAQNEAGALPGIVPTGGWGFQWGNGPNWDNVLVNLPYFTYIYRNDKEIVKENATAIFRYVHYLTTRMDANGLIAIGLGDWCSPDHPNHKAPLVLTDSITSFDICTKAAFLFDVLGMDLQRDFCAEVGKRLRSAIRARLIDYSAMTAAGNCQTSQAMTIFYDIFEPCEKQQAFQVLLNQIRERGNHIDTGILGARVIFHVLSAFGYSDLAYEMITVPTAPSYGEWVARGETSLPESFAADPLRKDSGNHHFFGDISSWFIQSIAGIRLNPYRCNINEVNIEPHFIEKLAEARAYHEAPAGKIAVEWKRERDRVKLCVSVPDSMTGRIRLQNTYMFSDGHSEKGLESGTHEYKVVRRN
jgi:alpha-L-rhamnosidase